MLSSTKSLLVVTAVIEVVTADMVWRATQARAGGVLIGYCAFCQVLSGS
jgi:hypothetical protein